jgi:anti-anti-sigma regulatory factor
VLERPSVVTDCTIAREGDGQRVAFRVAGVFDRAGAWALREKIERESGSELLLDFLQVRDFSDLGVAVLAHGITRAGQRVRFRGLRQHELRIFRYCGVAVDETSAREADATPAERAPLPLAQGPG